MDKQVFYRFHPVTGADANEFEMEGWNKSQKESLALVFSRGAKFYWGESPESLDKTISDYVRVERESTTFVLLITGIPFEFVESVKREE